MIIVTVVAMVVTGVVSVLVAAAVAVCVVVAAAYNATAMAVSAADAAVTTVYFFNDIGVVHVNWGVTKWHSVCGWGYKCESCTNCGGCDESCDIHGFSSSSLLASRIMGSASGTYYALHEPKMNV